MIIVVTFMAAVAVITVSLPFFCFARTPGSLLFFLFSLSIFAIVVVVAIDVIAVILVCVITAGIACLHSFCDH